MRYAHVVLGLPVDQPFDYEIPEELRGHAAAGCRVKVNFRGKKHTGYIVGGSEASAFPAIKPVLALIDENPLLTPQILDLTQKLSRYYCCSWGEMIETALPERLRKGTKAIPCRITDHPVQQTKASAEITVLRDPDPGHRWDNYCEIISTTLLLEKQVIILLPDTGAIAHCCARIRKKIPDVAIGVLFRKQPAEVAEWQKIRDGAYSVIVGTRSAVFAPVPSLGTIIVDDEHDHGYKQDQVPHYHARIAAITRAEIEGAGVFFGSTAPSLELMHMCREGKARLIDVPLVSRPIIKVIDTTRLPFGTKSRSYVSKYAQDAILSTITAGGKALIFINRKGFATTAACSSCGTSLRCPRCNTNLVYYFREQSLACTYCSFRMPPPKLCPACSSGYIKFTGAGTEKVESDLVRLFPAARIAIVSREAPLNQAGADIFVATQSILAGAECRFDLTVMLSLDNSLNHADFRATEKAFGLITSLAALTTRQLVIQTTVPGHYAVQALESADPERFYATEIALREQLSFPPTRHFAVIQCRGRSEEKTRAAAEDIFAIFSSARRAAAIPVSVTPGQPPRLRDNYYWLVLISGTDPEQMSDGVKICLNDFRRSGIIVTVDVDPV